MTTKARGVWSKTTGPMRKAISHAGFPRFSVSIRERGSVIIANIKTPERTADALEAIARSWFSAKHAWLYLFVYGPDGRPLISGLSDGVIPDDVRKQIISMRITK